MTKREMTEKDEENQYDPEKGVARHGAYLEKRRASILRTYEKPLLPQLTKILFFSMLLLCAVSLLAEIFNYSPLMGFRHFLINFSTTGGVLWAVYTILLFPLCLAGMRANARNYYKQKETSGISIEDKKDRERADRAVKRLNASYVLYLKVCLIGLLFWGVLYLTSVFFI